MSLTKVRLREAWNWGGLSARELAVRTWKSMNEHDIFNQAAVVAYYAMLALVPLLSFCLAIALGASSWVASEVLTLSAQFLPAEADKLVRDQIHKTQAASPVGILSISAVVLLWSGSSFFVAVMDTLNKAYGVQDERAWWKRRLLAIVLTLVEVVLVIGASVLAVVWPFVVQWLGLGGLAAVGATVVQWLVVIVVLLAAFELAYYFGPNIEQTWEWITPGAVMGALVLILASLGFRVYLYFSSSYDVTYGALAGVVLMLLWLYLAALALLVGAEVNCVIEHTAPHGRALGQKELPK